MTPSCRGICTFSWLYSASTGDDAQARILEPSHKRQASNGSLGSAASSDPETDNDSSSLSDFADGPVPEGSPENGSVEPTASLSNAFRVHLNALHSILQQMADSADYLSSRYQHELEPSNGSR
ncbi:mid1-interacting protein 1 isoform 1 [Tropilaelaps mercedesae]|uniref:Mid1-interacting protein 1 isoform 1 n=1 Tax=Tropilaelaps mercedesae TaxID=418985 RepID=A0A1V9XW19_9ACAR|nr:mid1-interacting protein 1 isoform 1 [Tropilaelaps mercedesae]